jgi:DNA ligase-1
VEFAQLAHCFEELEDTRSRLTMISLLAELFRSIATPGEIEGACYLIQGRVAPYFDPLELGMAEKTVARSIAIATHTAPAYVSALNFTLGDMGLAAEQAKIQAKIQAKTTPAALSVDDIVTGLTAIAQTSGKGAVESKVVRLAELLGRIDHISAKYVVRMLLGNLRLGVGDTTALDALAVARWSDLTKRKLLEDAYNKTSDLGLIARTLWQSANAEAAQRAVSLLDIQLGKPIRSQLAARLPSVESILAKMGEVLAQDKYDGVRVQIHKDGRRVTIFSRNLEDLSQMFPDLVESAVREVHAERAILDAEALAYNPASKEFLPFQVTARRRRKYQIEAAVQQLPLKAVVFDILYKDGESLLERPLVERLKMLEETIHPAADTVTLATSHSVRDTKTLIRLFDDAISRGLEGLVVKKRESHYEAGARNYNWVKLKRHSAGPLGDTIDCVLLGYLLGRGKRTALGVGALLVGVYDARRDLFVTVTKIGTGLSDDGWRGIRERGKGLEVDHRPARVSSLITPSVWLEPKIVIEVLADEITRSPIHTAGKVGDEPGYALRFPRVVSFREHDKRPEDATTVQELLDMFATRSTKV